MATMLSILEGPEILLEAGGDGDVDARDEVIYAGEPGVEVTVQQRLTLDSLGWFVSVDNGRWAAFTS